jgi:hypothetical protein
MPKQDLHVKRKIFIFKLIEVSFLRLFIEKSHEKTNYF